MQTVRRFVLAGLVLVLALVSVAQAQSLQFVPADAWVVLKINRLQQTNQKLQQFAKAIGVDQMVPQFADPLGSLQQELGLTQGVDLAGEVAVAFLSPELRGEAGEDAVLILIPVSDYDAFLKNFKNPQTDGEITQVKLPDTNDDGFVAHWGNYAAIGSQRKLVAVRPDGLRATPAALAQLDQQDLALYANVPAMRDKALPLLEENRQQIVDRFLKHFDQQAQKDPKAAVLRPVVAALANQMVNGAVNVLKDTQAATFGISLTEQGITTAALADFVPDSYIGGLVQKYQVNDQALFAGLPQADYLLLLGVNADPRVLSSLAEDIVSPLIQAAQGIEGPEGKLVADLLRTNVKLIGGVQGFSTGLIAPTAAVGQGALLQGVAVINGDVQQLIESQRRLLQLQADLASRTTTAQTEPKVSYTENAKTVAGVSLDQFKFDVNLPVDDPQARQVAQMMQLMYGPDGVSGYIGKIADNRALVTTGLSDQQVEQAVQAAKSNDTAVSQRQTLATVSDALPRQRIVTAYVPLDQVASTAAGYARQFGMRINLKLPPNLPPIGMVLAKENATLRADSLIPTQLIQSLVAAALQAAMGMQGGGGGMQ